MLATVQKLQQLSLDLRNLRNDIRAAAATESAEDAQVVVDAYEEAERGLRTLLVYFKGKERICE